MTPTDKMPPALALLADPLVQRMLKDSNYHFCDFAKEHTLQDIEAFVRDYSRAPQCVILAFALALPPELVSPFWDVLWMVDAARGETEREEDALAVVLRQVAARTAESGPPPAA